MRASSKSSLPAVTDDFLRGSSRDRDAIGTSSSAGEGETLDLVAALLVRLHEQEVSYCHWKSNDALHLSASGDNDLDLLVRRDHTPRFEEILAQLGFKRARVPEWKEIPGVFHWYALDPPSGRLVHVHAHYHLVLGDDMTKNYRLPIEDVYLASAYLTRHFKVPAPEFELAVFVVRMVLKHCPWDAIAMFQGSLSGSERRELSYLLGAADPALLEEVLGNNLSFVPSGLWHRCLRSLEPGCSLRERIATAHRLERSLASCARRPQLVDIYLKVWRRAWTVVRRKLLRRGPILVRPDAGGAVVALVGGDGAGKSTAVDALARWLGEEFWTVEMHLGKPARSPLSRWIKRAMGVAAAARRSQTSSAAHLRRELATPRGRRLSLRANARLLWEVLTARDRYRSYRRARRLSWKGAIVVCDRFPLPQIMLMDGPVSNGLDGSSRGRVFRYLCAREDGYYRRIAYPDVLVVLRVHPDVAVGRKLGEERESFLRPRSEEVWNADWRGSPAVVVDAGRPKADVVAEIKALVWSRL